MSETHDDPFPERHKAGNDQVIRVLYFSEDARVSGHGEESRIVPWLHLVGDNQTSGGADADQPQSLYGLYKSVFGRNTRWGDDHRRTGFFGVFLTEIDHDSRKRNGNGQECL